MTRASLIGLTAAYALCAPQPQVEPVRVCEVLQDLTAYTGKVVAVVGRYSFRQTGRFLSEESCDRKLVTHNFTWPDVMRVTFDEKDGPKPPEHMEIDTRTVYRKLRQIERHTALAKIRFGSPEYDRWAVVYGRVEPSSEFASSASPEKTDTAGFEPAPVRLVCRSDVVVMFFEAQPDNQ